MKYRAEWEKVIVATAGVVALSVQIFVGVLRLAGQAPPTQSPASQAAVTQSPTPQWQVDAGGKAAFDVVSVKQNPATPSPQTIGSNVTLDAMDDFTPTGGLLNASNMPLINYLIFAYKLNGEKQIHSVQSQFPKWANINRYDIQAKGPGNPTKDQMRLMMQALLADRFKLAIHFETRQGSVLALVLDKPGELGPQLRVHTDGTCWATDVAPGAINGNAPRFSITIEGGFPQSCGVIANLQPSAPGRVRVGARNVPLSMFTDLIDVPATGIGRPVLDRTGITGKVDFVIEFTRQFDGPVPEGVDQPDPNGPTFMEVLKEQLGLKLESQTGPIESIVVDHIEQPSEN